MKMKSFRIITAVLAAGLAMTATAQRGVDTGTPFGRGEDSTRCVRNTSLYSTYYENKDFNMALKFWRPLFIECPASSKNLYIKGEVMYKDLFRKTSDNAYIDTVMLILDQRTKYYNEAPLNTLRKAVALYELGGMDTAYAKQSYNYIRSVMENSPQYIDHTYSTLYTAITARCFMLKVLDADDLVNAYAEVTNIVDGRLARTPGDARFLDARKNIDAVFRSSGVASCDNLERLFSTRIEQHSADTAYLRKVIALLNEAGCTESDLYYKSATYLYKTERTAQAAANLAEMSLARKNPNDAEKYYSEAIELEKDPVIKSGLLARLATLELTSDNKQAARDFARTAYSLDNTNGNALFIIGESYAGARIGEAFENQTVYWVVVDYLVKAKNTDPSLKPQAEERIALYSKLFPTKEEAFFRSLIEEGASYRVGGWINETTTVRFRKE